MQHSHNYFAPADDFGLAKGAERPYVCVVDGAVPPRNGVTTMQFGSFKQSFGKFGYSRDVAIDIDELPEASLRFLITYGLKQKLADSYAGAKDANEVEARLDTVLGKIAEGTLAERTRASGDAVEREMVKIAREMLANALKAQGKTADKETAARLVEQLLDKKRDAIRAEAERRLAAQSIDLDDLFA